MKSHIVRVPSNGGCGGVADGSHPTDQIEVEELHRIGSEWDQNVESRAQELILNADPSYVYLCRVMLSNIALQMPARGEVLDIGCGLGFLTHQLQERAYHPVGVDVSKYSIAFAREHFPEVDFEHTDVGSYVESRPRTFHIALANMSLHNTPNLPSVLSAVTEALVPSGFFIATIPYPPSFLKRRVFAELDFSKEFMRPITLQTRSGIKHPAPVSYYHRPIDSYLTRIQQAGLEDIHFHKPAKVRPDWPPDIAVVTARRNDELARPRNW
jgi:SAM-dependent methyltransferase